MIRASLFVVLVSLLWGQVSPEAGMAALTTGLAAALIGWLAREERRKAR
jgi:Na+/proline symporter